MAVHLVGQRRPDAFVVNNLQIRLVASALAASSAPSLELLAPHAYVPSHVCEQWSEALFGTLSDLVLVEVWDERRAQLRPLFCLLPPVSLQRGARRGRRPVPDPWAALPPMSERTPVQLTPFGPVLLSLASWLGTCGGCSVVPGGAPL